MWTLYKQGPGIIYSYKIRTFKNTVYNIVSGSIAAKEKNIDLQVLITITYWIDIFKGKSETLLLEKNLFLPLKYIAIFAHLFFCPFDNKLHVRSFQQIQLNTFIFIEKQTLSFYHN